MSYPVPWTPNDGTYTPAAVDATPIPKQQPNLALWLDAGAGVTTDTGGVSVWADQSGNGYDASQVTDSRRPDLNATDSNLNDQPSITFDSGQAMATSLAEASTEWTWFAVVYNAVASGIRRVIDDGSGGFRWYGSGGNLVVEDGTNSLSVAMGVGAHVIACRLSASGLLRVDAAESTGTMAAVDMTSPRLGCRSTNYAADNWEDEMAEAIAYDRALTDGQVDTVCNYLGAKYDITVV